MKYDQYTHEDWQVIATSYQSLRDSVKVLEGILKHRPEIPARERFAEEDVKEIRRRFEEGHESVTKLALNYGVSKSTISRLVRLVTHKSV